MTVGGDYSDLPDEAIDFIESFDRDDPVAPIAFVLPFLGRFVPEGGAA